MLDFISFSLLDFLDILLVAVLLYYVYNLLRGTVAIPIVIGISILALVWQVTSTLKMEMISNILGTLIGTGVIAILIVFQPEIRKFLLMLGSSKFTSKKGLIDRFKFLKTEISSEIDGKSIAKACFDLSSTKTGLLIVLERINSLDFVRQEADIMNAEVNTVILESIFFRNSPLHDGAVIIKDNFITATRAVLPLSSSSLPPRYGLRHRAAVGVSERTDCVCLVVSEETGGVSYVKNGEIITVANYSQLVEKINIDFS